MPLAPSEKTNLHLISATMADPGASSISTVKRRSQSNATRQKPRPFGLDEAPTFRPSDEEFKNLMKYISSVAKEGSEYGVIKIIPPAEWRLSCAIDKTVSGLFSFTKLTVFIL